MFFFLYKIYRIPKPPKNPKKTSEFSVRIRTTLELPVSVEANIQQLRRRQIQRKSINKNWQTPYKTLKIPYFHYSIPKMILSSFQRFPWTIGYRLSDTFIGMLKNKNKFTKSFCKWSKTLSFCLKLDDFMDKRTWFLWFWLRKSGFVYTQCYWFLSLPNLYNEKRLNWYYRKKMMVWGSKIIHFICILSPNNTFYAWFQGL